MFHAGIYCHTWVFLIFRIRLPAFDRTGDHCLTFKYYMWGFHINHLDVFQENNNNDVTIIWTKIGQQKDMWLSGQIQVDLQSGDRVCQHLCILS